VNSKYLIERRLGGGGMAEVFLARTLGVEGFSRHVAIKRVIAGFSENPQFSQMFISEAQLTSQLRHANIVSVLDFDRDDEGRLCLVMELVDGTDLDGLVTTGPLPVSLVIFLAVEILRGLDYAHELPLCTGGVRGIVHRDISPQNVLLAWDGTVKISDFGIAKARAATDATASQIIKGKPSYMSPEQARGEPLDGRSDLFSVGVMLFEMLCLRPLFAGGTMEETISRLFFEPIPAPHELRPEIPQDLSRAVASLLVRERDLRTPSASAAIASLAVCADYPRDGRDLLITTLAQRFVGSAPVRAREIPQLSPVDRTLVARSVLPAQPPQRTVTAPSDLPSAPNPAPFGFQLAPKRKPRWLWASLASLLVAGAIGVVVASARSSKAISTVAPLADKATPTALPGSAALDVTPPSSPIAPPEPTVATSGRADPAASSAPKVLSPPPQRDHAPSYVPARRTQHAPPRAEGIREIHL